MAFGIGRSLSAPMLVINFLLYLIAACLAGWALNRNMGATVGLGGGPVGKFSSAFAFLVLLYVVGLMELVFSRETRGMWLFLEMGCGFF